MRLSVIGISHQTAPIELREKISFSKPQLENSFHELKNNSKIHEAVILSTCNRTEIYWYSKEQTTEWIIDFLTEKIGKTDLRSSFYHKTDAEAIEHLFHVASGLDSMVVGENEILKQVKEAYLACHENGLTGKYLNVLFQRALYVGKLTRTHTGISKGGLSVASVAVSLAELIFGPLEKSTVLVFGAGEMAEITVRFLISKKVKKLMVANRTLENAQTLANLFQAQALSLDEGLQSIENADIIITSMSFTQPIITKNFIEKMMAQRQNRSLFIIDIAVPRNVETTAHALDNVYVYNIDDLENLVQENTQHRSGEIQKAKDIVNQKSTEFYEWYKSLQSGEEKSLKHQIQLTNHEKIS